MNFDPIATITTIAKKIEGEVPTSLESYFIDQVKFLKENGIENNMHVGQTQWTRTTASEWLLSQFIGIIEKAQEDQRIYSALGTWLTHSYHFVIDNKVGLLDK